MLPFQTLQHVWDRKIDFAAGEQISFWGVTWMIWILMRVMVCEETLCAERCTSFWLQILHFVDTLNLISLECTAHVIPSPCHVLHSPSVWPLLPLPQDSPSIFTQRQKEAPKQIERERGRENISLIYITRLFQSNMAIHQRGFQWQPITRLPGSSACRLCCCRSLGPQPPNSPWKQYLYIYYIFTASQTFYTFCTHSSCHQVV